MEESNQAYFNQNRIIFYDGLCAVCNYWVNKVLDSKNGERFMFTHLENSEATSYLKSQLNLNKLPDAIAYKENGIIYFKSEAALRVGKSMGGIFRVLASPLLFIGAFSFYNVFYDLIAKNRYRWFGQNKKCRLLTTKERTQFISF